MLHRVSILDIPMFDINNPDRVYEDFGDNEITQCGVIQLLKDKRLLDSDSLQIVSSDFFKYLFTLKSSDLDDMLISHKIKHIDMISHMAKVLIICYKMDGVGRDFYLRVVIPMIPVCVAIANNIETL
jgi:hypothetical protein